MKKLGVLLILALVASALGVGGWWVYQSVVLPMLAPAEEALGALDSALDRKDWVEVKKLLDRRPGTWENRRQAFSWIRRARDYAQGAGDWVPAVTFSQSLAQQFPPGPQNPEVLALLTWVNLRAGRSQDALDQADRLRGLDRPAIQDRYRSLWQEAHLKYGSELPFPGPGEDRLTALDRSLKDQGTAAPVGLYQVLASFFPPEGEPERWSPIRNNTALVLLKDGQYSQAKKYLEGPQKDLFPPVLRALYYYDMGDWDLSFSLLRTLPDLEKDPRLKLLLADILLQRRNYEQAWVVYRQILEKSPDYSLLPYLNLATGYESRGQEYALKQALEVLTAALENPNSVGVESRTFQSPPDGDLLLGFRLFLTEMKYKNGMKEQAFDLVSRPEASSDEEVLRYRLFPEMLSMPRLHTLFSRLENSPQLDRLTEFLVWRLMVTKELDSALSILSQWEKRTGGPSWWSQYYRTLVLGLAGQYKDALGVMASIDPKWQDFYYYYNRGLLHCHLGDTQNVEMALKQWEIARGFIRGPGVEAQPWLDKDYSRLYAWLAQGQESIGQTDLALQSVDLALGLDPSNLQAYLIKQRLKAPGVTSD